MPNKALLLGINDYKTVNHLRGCENDVRSMEDLLKNVFQFGEQNVRSLLNQKVTKTEVTRQMKWLFKDVAAGDQVILHYSGHGSAIPDHDDDEDDGVDELICLYDMDFDDSHSYFTDDELRAWTKDLPQGALLTVILDCCHSGTGTRMILPIDGSHDDKPALVNVVSTMARAVKAVGARGMAGGPEAVASAAVHLHPDDPAAVIARYVPPPPELQRELIALQGRRAGARGLGEETMNHVLLAGCRDDQTSADATIEGGFHGAFTYYLCQAVKQLGVDADRAKVIDNVKQALSTNSFDQIPQLEGPSRFKHGGLFGSPGDRPTAEPDETKNPGPGASTSSSEYRQLLLLLQELLTRLGPVPVVRASTTRAPGSRFLVYVHGICRHVAGYSNGWWDAMSPYVPSLQPGDLGGNRLEVLWSDLVNARALTVGSTEQRELRDQLMARINDRIERQALAAAPVARPGEAARALVTPRALPSVPWLNCIDDFTVYMLNDGVRRQIIDRFTTVVRPLLAAGNKVEVISHSWGTVVAYEALRLLDDDTSLPTGSVLNFFTVGSALSIYEVKQHLLPQTADGQRPRLAARWLNLNAHGDAVGGPLMGNPYQVDEEFLNLDPTGCTAIFGVVNPVCAHSSYFQANNLAVNRDIFGARIES